MPANGQIVKVNKQNGSMTCLGQKVDYNADPWYRFCRVTDLLDRYVQIPRGAKWLDAGCQIGQFLKLLHDRYGIDPTGIDDFNRDNVVDVCKRHLRLEIQEPSEILNDSWRYLTRRIHEVGFDIKEKFQFISALEVIEHMVDTDDFLRECRSHIEDQGYLVISTPNINSLRNRLQVPFGIYPSGMEYRTVNHHVRLYNVDTLVSHVEEHGFTLVGLSGVSFFPRRFVINRFVRTIDAWLADHLPSFCSCIIALFSVKQIGQPVGTVRE